MAAELTDDEISEFKEAFRSLGIVRNVPASITKEPDFQMWPWSYVPFFGRVNKEKEEKKSEPEVKVPGFVSRTLSYIPFLGRVIKKEEEKKSEPKMKMVDRLTDGQINMYNQVFSLFDERGDGRIKAKELGTVMRIVGQDPTEAELLDMIVEVADGNGTIGFPEFLSLVATKIKDTKWKEDLYQAFRVFDTNDTGFISVDALRGALEKLGGDLSDDEVDDMISEAHKKGDDLVNYKDFVKIMTEG